MKALSFILPFTALAVIPGALLLYFGFRICSPLIQIAVSLPFLAAGIALMARTIALIHRTGRGTLAPWSPTEKLVIRGPYRYSRNPMITGLLFLLIAESILFGSLAVAAWTIVFFATNTVYFKLFEEPGLVKRFGKEYEEYRNRVPMWFPEIIHWGGKNRKQRQG